MKDFLSFVPGSFAKGVSHQLSKASFDANAFKRFMNLNTCVSKTLIRLSRRVRWLMKASSDDLEHTGAGWAGLVGRLVGVGDGLGG